MASRHLSSQSFLRGGQKFLGSLKTGALYRAGQRDAYEYGNNLGFVPAGGHGLIKESYYPRDQCFARLLVAVVAGGSCAFEALFRCRLIRPSSLQPVSGHSSWVIAACCLEDRYEELCSLTLTAAFGNKGGENHLR